MLRSIYKRWENSDYIPIPEGESPIDVETRSIKVIKSVLSNPHRNCLIVAHGRMLKIVLSSLLDLGLHNMHTIEQDNTAVNILEYKEDKFHPVVLNCTNHLQDK